MTPPGDGDRPRAASPDNLADAVRVFSRHWSPRILAAAALVAVAVRAGLAEWSLWDLAVVAGIVAGWPVLEWLIHVFILHFKPFVLMGRTVDFPLPQSHRAHHRDPMDLDLVFIPTYVFTYSLPLLLLGWFATMPTAALALTGVAAYFVLALNYEWIHFLVHTRYRPRSRPYQRLWRNHRLHHYKNEHFWYGVTRLGGDRLLGTAPAVQGVPTSPTCRTLGQEATLGAAS